MKRFIMYERDIKSAGDCRFSGTLARDGRGLLYDSRFRQAIHDTRRSLSEQETRTVEALTALRISSRLIRQLMDRWAEKHGLSEGRLHLLFQLAAAPGHMRPLGELAEQLDVSPRNVTGLIDHLERDGLVERVHDPDDRRSIHARLTPAGGKRLDGIRAQSLHWQLAIAAGFSAEELENLRHTCLRLIQNMTTGRVAAASGNGRKR